MKTFIIDIDKKKSLSIFWSEFEWTIISSKSENLEQNGPVLATSAFFAPRRVRTRDRKNRRQTGTSHWAAVFNISISMADIAEIQLKIKAVEVALSSFSKFRNKEEERVAFLDSQLETVQYLDVYSDFPKDKLQDALNKLQDEKNLLLAQQQGRNVI